MKTTPFDLKAWLLLLLALAGARAARAQHRHAQAAGQRPFCQRLGSRPAGYCPAGLGANAPITWALLRAGE